MKRLRDSVSRVSSGQKLRNLGYLFLAALATAAGSAAVSTFSKWWGGIPTISYVDRAVAPLARTAAVNAQVGELSAHVEREGGRLRALEDARTLSVESVCVEVRERVGQTVMRWRALEAAKLPERQRRAITAAGVTARSRFDELVLRGLSPQTAAEKVLAEQGVPR